MIISPLRGDFKMIIFPQRGDSKMIIFPQRGDSKKRDKALSKRRPTTLRRKYLGHSLRKEILLRRDLVSSLVLVLLSLPRKPALWPKRSFITLEERNAGGRANCPILMCSSVPVQNLSSVFHVIFISSVIDSSRLTLISALNDLCRSQRLG